MISTAAGRRDINFGLDSVSYEMDLVPPDMARLAKALARFIAAVGESRRGQQQVLT